MLSYFYTLIHIKIVQFLDPRFKKFAFGIEENASRAEKLFAHQKQSTQKKSIIMYQQTKNILFQCKFMEVIWQNNYH